MIKEQKNFAVKKSYEVISVQEGMLQVTCNPLLNFQLNGSTTVNSYWFLNVMKTSLVTKKSN